MAKKYKAKLELSCLKRHTCLSCDSVFQYRMTRKTNAEADSEVAAQEAAIRQITQALDSGVDVHACPHCGYVQPDMVAQKQSPWFTFSALIVLVGLATALIAGLAHGFTIDTSAKVAAGSLAATLLMALVGALINPNRNRAGNLDRAQGNGQVELVSDVRAFPDLDRELPAASTSAYTVALATIAVSAALVLTPLFLQIGSGWTLNDGFYPAVVGAGDTSCLYFDQDIRSINGKWNGGVIAVATNWQTLGLSNPNLRGTTSDSHWGDVISGKSVSNATHAMWAKLTLPESGSLAGKTMELDVTVHANFPLGMAGGFIDQTETFQQRSQLHLASAGAGRLYHRTWWMSLAAAALLTLIAEFKLMSANGGLAAASRKAETLPLDAGPP